MLGLQNTYRIYISKLYKLANSPYSWVSVQAASAAGGAYILWYLFMELSLCQRSDSYVFTIAARFHEHSWIPAIDSR